MLSYQVCEYYSDLREKMENFKPSLEVILEFGNKYKKVISNILKKIMTTRLIRRESNNVHYIIRDGGIQEEFRELISGFRTKFVCFAVFKEYEILKNDVEKIIDNNEIKENAFFDFFKNLDTFFELYQEFIQKDGDIELAVDLGQIVDKISSSYEILIKTYKEFENNIYDNVYYETEESIGEISIQLLNIQYDLEQFSNNLILINEIYDLIGTIIYRNDKYEKIQIKKIESGSLLSKIIGDKNIIETISLFLNKTVNLVFNKFTYEGKLLRYSELKKELIENVELTENMKNLGYDVEYAEENNKEVLTMLTKDLLKLSSSSPKIKINENEYSIKEMKQQEFIEQSKILLLTDGSEESKNNTD